MCLYFLLKQQTNQRSKQITIDKPGNTSYLPLFWKGNIYLIALTQWGGGNIYAMPDPI